MGAKVNLVLDEALVEELDRLVPPGRRSRVVNEAVSAWLARLRRRRASETLERLRKTGPAVPTSEVVEQLQEARHER